MNLISMVGSCLANCIQTAYYKPNAKPSHTDIMQTQASLPLNNAHFFAQTMSKKAQHSTTLPSVNAQENQVDADLSPRKLLLIEDHLAMVDGMMPTLQKDFQVAVVNSLPKMQLAIAEEDFSLAVVDLTLLGQAHGLGMMPILRDAGITFLVFSGTADDWHIRAAIRMGARAYVDKRDGLAMLHHAIATIDAGGTYFPDNLREKLATDPELQLPKKLGPSEIAVMNKLFEMTPPGTNDVPSNIEIGAALHRVPRRIANIFTQLFIKFEVSDGRRALFEDLKKRGYFPGILIAEQKTPKA